MKLEEKHLGKKVSWWGQEGEVIGLTIEPSAVLKLDNGRTVTVGQSVLQEMQ
jgi:hypothetical protein